MASSGSHLLLVGLTLAGIDGGRAALSRFYAGTMSCPKLASLSLVMYLGQGCLKSSSRKQLESFSQGGRSMWNFEKLRSYS